MFTLAEMAIFEEEIRKSRFVAHAGPVSTPDDTFAFLEQVKDAQATHNCWAFRIGTNFRFSDDGEPKGTAGRPILTAIERQKLDCVMVIVTRYFGGIKLGAGGLTRAYGGVANACLKDAPRKEVQPMVRITFEAGFDLVGHVYSVLGQHDAEKLEEEYTERGHLITARLTQAAFPSLEKSLLDLSRGAIRVRVDEES
jgi:uncharacterized YigZ family protein